MKEEKDPAGKVLVEKGREVTVPVAEARAEAVPAAGEEAAASAAPADFKGLIIGLKGGVHVPTCLLFCI